MPRTKTEDTDTAQIIAKLNTLVRLVAVGIASDKALTLQQRALRLRRAGMMPKEIAELCGSTPNAVNVALSKAGKKAKSKEEDSDGEG